MSLNVKNSKLKTRRNTMISERLNEVYGKEVPIFSEEILKEYPNYSKVYVFRKLKEEIFHGLIIQFDRGVYFVPFSKNPFSTINATQVMEKKYIGTKKNPVGLYSGYFLKNQFEITRQMSNVREIVSNNESSRRRNVRMDGMDFIVKKSRVEITKDNINQYRLLELFSESSEDEFNSTSIKNVKEYMKKEKISKKSLLELSKYFPKRAITSMINLGVI